MSPRGARLWVWLVLVVSAPLPLWAVETARVPPARALELAAVCAALILRESAQGVVGILLGAFLVQALAQAALLWLVAWVAVRGLAGASARARRTVVVAVAVAWLVGVSVWPVYRTPFRVAGLHATWLEVFQ